MRWRLIIEEFSPELIYLKGERNIVADALSRLELQNSDVPSTKMHDLRYLAEHFALEDEHLQSDAFPVHYKLLAQHQSHQKDFFTKHTQDYHLKSFRGGGTTHILVCRNEKIVIPTTLQRRVVTWYHDILCHAGETRTEQTLKQQYWWPNLRDSVHDVCSKCNVCQRTKRSTQKYGQLPAKEAEADPWEVLCIDLIATYTIKGNNKQNLILWCVTIIDPATGWFEMRKIPNKEAITVANLIEQS
jgi:hypothetical protein